MKNVYYSVDPKIEGFNLTRAYEGDAGIDLVAVNVIDEDESTITYDTGLSVKIPNGYVGKVFSRSSIYKTGLVLCNSVGIIDSGYTGRILAKFYKVGKNCKPYVEGDRICQLIIEKLPKGLEYVPLTADAFSGIQTARGNGGFGSSGK